MCQQVQLSIFKFLFVRQIGGVDIEFSTFIRIRVTLKKFEYI